MLLYHKIRRIQPQIIVGGAIGRKSFPFESGRSLLARDNLVSPAQAAALPGLHVTAHWKMWLWSYTAYCIFLRNPRCSIVDVYFYLGLGISLLARPCSSTTGKNINSSCLGSSSSDTLVEKSIENFSRLIHQTPQCVHESNRFFSPCIFTVLLF